MKKEKTSKIKHEKALERILTKRLFFLGSLMAFFGSAMFAFAIYASSYSQKDEMVPSAEETELSTGLFAALDFSFSDLTEKEKQHSYLIAALFTVIGATLIVISKRKKRKWEEDENSNC